MKEHELKILPSYFAPVNDGRKTWEIRKFDRNFQAGDRLRLKEFDGVSYTGRECLVEILWMIGLNSFRAGYIGMTVALVKTWEEINPANKDNRRMIDLHKDVRAENVGVTKGVCNLMIEGVKMWVAPHLDRREVMLSHVANMTEEQFLKVPSCGEVSLERARVVLKEFGFFFK